MNVFTLHNSTYNNNDVIIIIANSFWVHTTRDSNRYLMYRFLFSSVRMKFHRQRNWTSKKINNLSKGRKASDITVYLHTAWEVKMFTIFLLMFSPYKVYRLFMCTLTHTENWSSPKNVAGLFQKGAVVGSQVYLAVSKDCDDRDA